MEKEHIENLPQICKLPITEAELLAMHFLGQKKDYPTQLQEETDGWRDIGLYKKLVDRLVLSPETAHLDLGAGTCELAIEVKRRSIMTLVKCVEYDRAVARQALSNIRKNGFKAQIVESPQDIPQDREVIQILIADFNNRKLIQELLGQPTVDSVSYSLAGNHPVKQNPMQRVSQTKLDEAFIKSAQQGRSSAVKIATEFVRPGGKFILGSRLGTPTKDANLEEVPVPLISETNAATIFTTSGIDPLRYWEHSEEEAGIINVDTVEQIKTELGWIATPYEEVTPDLEGNIRENGIIISITSLIRKQAKYPPIRKTKGGRKKRGMRGRH